MRPIRQERIRMPLAAARRVQGRTPGIPIRQERIGSALLTAQRRLPWKAAAKLFTTKDTKSLLNKKSPHNELLEREI
ncbi:hypothetical protein, partial [Rheinheimera sp. WS51]|uniref:hypothetical protein n=1 Tax=Rheinheimera sp. WS51 TaxID=3425886 RepID=UPI003D940F78